MQNQQAVSRSRKVIFLTYMVPSYRIRFLNHLLENFPIDLQVVYLAQEVTGGYFDGYSSQDANFYQNGIQGLKCQTRRLKSHTLRLGKRTVIYTCGLGKALSQYKPDILIIGTNLLSSPVSWQALLWAKSQGISLIRFEGMHAAYAHEFLKFGLLRETAYRLFFKAMDAFFVYSRLSEHYLRSLGIPSEKITVGYNVGDTDFFREVTARERSAIGFGKKRAQYPKVLFLFAGRLIGRKNISGMLDAFEALADEHCGLMILGDGPLRGEVEARAAKAGRSRLFFEGYQSPESCPAFFALADVLLLPSFVDSASIVLSEALVSGLFVVASEYDGSAQNFIQDGINGVKVDPRDNAALTGAMCQARDAVIADKFIRKKIQETMKEFTVERYAERLGVLLTHLAIKKGNTHVRH